MAVMVMMFCGTAYAARDYIEIVGSSTVYPFSTTVAEQFGRTSEFPTPKVESTGSGGGLKLFCQGIGTQTPDMTNASRAIKHNLKLICVNQMV
jgi:phosphate transport system substrate-binding protein